MRLQQVLSLPGQSEPGSYKGTLHTFRVFRTGALPSDAVYCHTRKDICGADGVLNLFRR